MCVFVKFYFYLLVVVGTRAVVTHDRYLHDNIRGILKKSSFIVSFARTHEMSHSLISP